LRTLPASGASLGYFVDAGSVGNVTVAFTLGNTMTRNICAALAILLTISLGSTALALPPLPRYVAQHYQASPEYAKFAATFGAMTTKCDTCHTPGADKKAKGHGLNDFGKAVHDNFKHKDFLAADKAKDNPGEAAKAKKLVDEALAAAEALKNADGKTFGELIKAGTLPGKN